jgi:hypothetical protein
MATQLLTSYGNRAFEVSMPDEESYNQMRSTFAQLGRQTGPDGEFFVIKVFPDDDSMADGNRLQPIDL